ncbi:UNKNOWN [Stylonychia lemnae]|uniref:Rhodanese domain-containing protein n=1 Tax=Stylonychia lemnae TaxID=5949 RepID=A0A077ZPC4_STYLE|nr:UNKNOWN [Stylonychia lemnae]|eukprot:CDW71773.1 UNKNOWN [Stylonychia lemnae]
MIILKGLKSGVQFSSQAIRLPHQLRMYSSDIRKKLLIETDELDELIKKKPSDLKIINGSFFLPKMKRNARQEHIDKRIPGARFFDIDEITNKSFNMPRMIPTLEQFKQHMDVMGVHRDDEIVCYDNLGIFSSPRVAFTFKYFGAERVRVLNGGFVKWLKENRLTESGPEISTVDTNDQNEEIKRPYEVVDEERLVNKIEEMHRIAYLLMNNMISTQVIDARSPGRYFGEEDEGPNVRRGHFYGAKNAYYHDFVDQETQTFKSDKEIAKYFLSKDVDTSLTTISYCGSGVSACIANLALELMGNDRYTLYDGSWSEYGSVPEPHFERSSMDQTIPSILHNVTKSHSDQLHHQFLQQDQMQIKQMEINRKENEMKDELKKRFPKHLYNSDESESDYDLKEEDMHPQIRSKLINKK